VEFRLLGPVELWAYGKQIPFPSTKVKQLYAALLWDAGRLVPTATLIRRVWGDEAPPRELASLQANASKLRKALGECGDPTIALTQISMGYRLVVPSECIDRIQFERTVSLAEAAVDRADINEAIRLLRSAEALVRGEEPLTGLLGRWAGEARAVLEERIREVAVKRITLQLQLGDTRAVLPELYRLTAKHEFDERIFELLLRTLRDVGRTTDALDAYTVFQARLRHQKGLEPHAPLKRLHDELLHDGPVSRPLTATAVAVARSQASATAAASRPLPPNTLDRDPPSFVGRHRDIEAITSEIDSQLAAGASVVYAIDGMPGVGKTTLALRLAHRLHAHCPDGQLQLHLRGHDEHQSPTDPETALGILLGMLGVEPLQIQRAGSLDLAIALWRKHTAGKRLLLLLDDAANASQVTPLIPSGTGSVVLITARTRLTGLPEAARHPLEPMPDDEAGQLFVSSARISATTDPALRDVIAACGGFPLALAVAGNAFRTRPAWSIGDLAEHLANARTAAISRPDAVIGPLFRVFFTSYRDLPEFERTLLRRLSLNPGLRTHLRAAAALVDAEPSETDSALFNLVEQNLVMEPERHQYQLHDMIRIFAAHACETEENPQDLQAAANRLMYYTVGAVDAATKLVYPHRHAMLAEPAEGNDVRDGFGFSDLKQATRWLESEQQWLRTAIEFWFANGHAQEAATLVNLLSRFLDRKNLWKESIALHESSFAAWRSSGNRAAKAQTLVDLAAAHWRLGAWDTALTYAARAFDHWSALGDANGSADALLQMGRAHHAQHRNADAIACFSRCARHWQEVGDHQTAAVALQHLSAAQFDAGHHREAITSVEAALDLAETSDDLAIRCNCLNNLGVFLLRLGEHARAGHYYLQALQLADQIGDPNRTAAFALNLAVCQLRLGQPESALPLLDRAYETFSALDDPRYLTSTLIAQAEAHLGLGRDRDAQALIDAAAVPAERFGDPEQLARVHVAYGRILTAAGEFRAALRAFRLALGFAGSAHVPYMQSVAYRDLGDLYKLMGRTDAARRCWHRALSGFGDLPSPEAAALQRKLAADT
jgi:DNA-binding SARP family transcriptional activator/tetratricopeptide (TPR) repeat protein